MTALAVAQFAPTADRARNLEEIAELVARARGRGAEVVLFPEYASYFVHPFDETVLAHAEDLAGEFVTGLRAIAREQEIVIVAGLLERADHPSRVRNTLVAVDGDAVLARYRKLHLYDAFGQRESDWIEAGTIAAPETFERGGLRFALLTCYDLRFPEVTRVLADAGADVALVPAQWVPGPLKEHHWRTLLRARAIENTMYVAGAGHPPPLGIGASTIVDPLGVDIAAVGTGNDIVVAHVDADAVARVRRVNPALRLRRFWVEPRT